MITVSLKSNVLLLNGNKSFHYICSSCFSRSLLNPFFFVVAQELKTAANATDYADHMRLVHDDNPDKLEADPMKMFPILVKAVQELSAKNTALEARVKALEDA